MLIFMGTVIMQYGAKFRNKIMQVRQYLFFYVVVIIQIWKRIIQHSQSLALSELRH